MKLVMWKKSAAQKCFEKLTLLHIFVDSLNKQILRWKLQENCLPNKTNNFWIYVEADKWVYKFIKWKILSEVQKVDIHRYRKYYLKLRNWKETGEFVWNRELDSQFGKYTRKSKLSNKIINIFFWEVHLQDSSA